MAARGRFTWNELVTPDPKASRKFYGEVAGWTFEEVDVGIGPYTIAKAGGNEAAGLFGMVGRGFEDVAPQWIAHIEVEDCDEAVKRAVAAGGAVHAGPFDVPTVGRIAFLTDPMGAVFALMRRWMH